jgi:hypothetical protein
LVGADVDLVDYVLQMYPAIDEGMACSALGLARDALNKAMTTTTMTTMKNGTMTTTMMGPMDALGNDKKGKIGTAGSTATGLTMNDVDQLLGKVGEILRV